MPQKAQHLFAAKAHHRMMHQRWINPLQRSTLVKHHVGGVFALGSRPVVVALDGAGDLGAKRMALLHQRVEQARPVRAQLLRHQRLGVSDIGYPWKTVVLSPISNSSSVHLARQPLPSVETDLNQKREPSLKPKMQKTQLFMEPVKVKVCAFTPLSSSYCYPKTKTNMFVIMSSLRKFSGDRRLSDSDMPPAKAQRRQVRKRCHFDPFGQAQGKLREKSFLDPSHSLGMTGMGSSPLRLGAFAGDNSAFGCSSAALVFYPPSSL